MHAVECTGLEIPLELHRMVQISDRPYVYLEAKHPIYKGLSCYEGLKLKSMSTRVGKDGKITDLRATFSQMELGMSNFTWTPEGVEKNPQDLEILKLTIFSYGKDQRVALKEGRFEQFISQLPTPLSPEYLKVIEYQRWLESTLPKL